MRSTVALAAALLAIGCRFDEKAIGPSPEQIVVHAVLDPGRFAHRILLERTLTGRVGISDRIPFDSLDPIRSHGGSPESGATVIVYGPAGDSAVAQERLAVSDGQGTGMYEFVNRADANNDGPASPAVVLAPGATYRLHISTIDGRVLSASTTIPAGVSAFRDQSLRIFNRDRQSLFLFWDAVAAAARYEIAASSPNGAFSIFVDSLEFAVTGSLKNTRTGSLGDVFLPGFMQDLTASAVDQNYFDYYRSRNDVFSGRGLLNHVEGGLGVFGSIVVLRFIRLDVTADFDHRLEGIYDRLSGPGPRWIRLFVVSDDVARQTLSGNYEGSGLYAPGAIGTVRGDSVSLALLRGQSAHDTVMTIDGVLDAGRLRGRVRGGGSSVEYQLLILPSDPSR